MDEGWFAIIGAGVGGLLGIAGTLLMTFVQQRGEDRRAIRPELKELVVSILVAAQNARNADLEMERAYNSIAPWNTEWQDELEKAGARWSNAQQAAWDKLPLLRITHKGLAAPAEELILTCRMLSDPDQSYTFSSPPEMIALPPKELFFWHVTKRYASARDAFEEAARKELRID